MSVDDAIDRLKLIPFEDLGFAKVDHHRSIRQGVPEVVYGAGKTVEQIVAIAESMLNQGSGSVLVTRITEDTASEISRSLPIEYDPSSRIGVVGSIPGHEGVGKIVVVSAGTSDIPVAEEAAVTAEFLGSKVTRIYDAGVAGIHRLLAHSEDLVSARVVIAVAGMEGALPSVVGGLVECPVIAVPTSVGYGASFGGLSALLTMLNSCASGISVVNIDNGFGAGFLADRINRMESP
ncbi:MAG: nickel pincer cofactor biosynthesis protein LarB [Candidatus Methanomethylophilaceae archaeon]|nr:nickel pincer cofactor biosynthesis protein LarB [Candidatus Methanomethylophilaceae archaeon]